MQEQGKLHKPMFFREVPHPFITNQLLTTGQEKPVKYLLVENEEDKKGYWERRERKDWGDMPKLWND